MKRIKLSTLWTMLITLFISTLFSPIAVQAGENTFTGNGPFGGRVTALEFDPSDASRAYALGFRNGLFFSDDGGSTWARFEVDHPSIDVASISDFGIDPDAPSTMWVVDSDSEIARTTDRGATWTVSTVEGVGDLYNIMVDQANSGTLFVYNTSTLLRSTDNGDTWTEVTTGLNDSPLKSIMQSPSDPSVFMALGWDGPFKSTDGGQTWTLMANNLPLTNNGYIFANYGVFDPSNSDIALINISNQQNWRTLDGGATWARYGTGVPNDFFTGIVRDPAVSSRLFMGTGNNDVIVSNDNGLSWGAADLSGLAQYSVNDIAFDPASPTRLLIGTSTKGIFESQDEGANWTLSTEGFTNIGVDSIAVDSDSGFLYAGITGGTSTSSDDGLTWVANIGTYDLQTFAMEADPLLDDHVYAGSSCCGLYESFDAGQTWARINLDISGVFATWVTDIDIPNSNTQQLLFSDYNRGLFGTTDGGSTWSQLSVGLESFFTGNVVLEGVDAAESNPNIVFTTSPDFQRGGVFRSADFGATWERKSGDGIAGPSRAYSVAIHPQNPNIVFAGGSSLHRSIDGGDTWFFPNTGVAANVFAIEIDQDNPQLMYALSEFNGLYRSVDGGNNWTQAPDDGVTQRTNSMEVHPNERGRVFVGYDDVGYQEITYSTDLQLNNMDGALTGMVGEDLSVAMTVTATGPITANGVLLEADIPSEFSINSAVADTGACAIDGQSISCTLGALEVANTSVTTVSLTPLTNGNFSVLANVSSLESDPVAADNMVEVAVTIGEIVDTDGDGVADGIDNCSTVANVDQADTDADGYGNACDGDFNNDCVVNFVDIAAFSGEFLGTNPLYDMNNDSFVNFLDFSILTSYFLAQPGPGVGSCGFID